MQPQTRHEILQLLQANNADAIKLAVTDIDGVLRGKLISFEKFVAIAEKGFGFCNVVFGWDSGDMAYDNTAYTGWHTGYPDATAVIDFDSFRKIPWENDTPFFLADFKDEKGKDLAICPRSLLKRINNEAIRAGYTPFFSQEFEWFNVKDNANELHQKSFADTRPITQGMFGYSMLRAAEKQAFFYDIYHSLKKFDIPLEGLHTETGPGVYEAAITYSDIIEAADRAVLFKSSVKQIAKQHGIIATFMAKFTESLPGCSGHVHQSLWDAAGNQNLFYTAKSKTGISTLMESYMAGLLHCMPHILPMYAPTVNSYKRLVEGAWAPTTLTWGIDNRTTALRALPGSPTATRLETRVVGSDCNPYLAMAACLASGLYGIKNNMKLKTKATNGNGYTDIKNGVLPKNLWEATQAMKNSGIAKELFGETFVAHFTATREWEWRQFMKVVTDWEMKRYMEII
ncbi:MAG TPA: glutamine synthetase family protein [Ferruginibacter sp.]|nr:glutamine synthetase family protein [Ferruginibacter sp.]HMP21799.1 glutamine synthetase family protein [Ferruginibacter sp.]